MKLSQALAKKKINLLMMSDSGGGKTGALGSLANAGFKLNILDYDNGYDILTDPAIVKPEFLDNISVVSCRDDYSIKNSHISIDKAEAFGKGMDALHNWPDVDVPDINLWGPDTVFILDSYTSFGESILDSVLKINNHDKPTQPDWGQAMREQEKFIAKLT